MDPGSDTLLLGIVAPGIGPGTSGFVALKADHYTTEAIKASANIVPNKKEGLD
jgi:hypothetical protein